MQHQQVGTELLNRLKAMLCRLRARYVVLLSFQGRCSGNTHCVRYGLAASSNIANVHLKQSFDIDAVGTGRA